MGQIVDLNDLINRGTGGAAGNPENIWSFKESRVGGAAAVNTVAGRWSSLWQYQGAPSHGAVPGAASIPDNTTNGSLRQTDPGGGGLQKWITNMVTASASTGTLVLYDRLLHISGFSGTNTGAQVVQAAGVPALTRYTSNADSIGNKVWVEIYTIIGTTGTTISMNYTDNDGNSGQVSPLTAIGATGLREVNRLIEFPLATGDRGVQGVASVTLTATTGTVGDFGVTIGHPLVVIPMANIGTGLSIDMVNNFMGCVEILPGACLAWAWLANATASPMLSANIFTVEA